MERTLERRLSEAARSANDGAWLDLLLVLAACAALPLLGAWMGGRFTPELFQFPPRLAIPSDYPRFSWAACALIVAAAAAVVIPWIQIRRPAAGVEKTKSGRRFPWWGQVAIAWTLAWWGVAWTRWPLFDAVRPFTFFPLWLGFVVAVNALVFWRRGRCLMTRAPLRWLGLFAASAVFWWVFEWLNRFVRNWHYLGVSEWGPAKYAVHATLCFSTVLPAVAAVREALGTSDRLRAWCTHGPRWRWLAGRRAGVASVALGGAGLFLTGWFPQQAYPALWSAPLLIGAGLEAARREPRGFFAQIAAGDWREAAPWALAALGCGFFWEMWNLPSLAKWIYTVPYVDRWRVFEMPLLGYSGYLPFGWECALLARRVTRDSD